MRVPGLCCFAPDAPLTFSATVSSITLPLSARRLLCTRARSLSRSPLRAAAFSKMLASPLLPSPRFAEETSYKPAKDLESFNKLLPPPVEFVEGSSSGVLAVAEGKYTPINEGPKSSAAPVPVSLLRSVRSCSPSQRARPSPMERRSQHLRRLREHQKLITTSQNSCTPAP